MKASKPILCKMPDGSVELRMPPMNEKDHVIEEIKTICAAMKRFRENSRVAIPWEQDKRIRDLWVGISKEFYDIVMDVEVEDSAQT